MGKPVSYSDAACFAAQNAVWFPFGSRAILLAADRVGARVAALALRRGFLPSHNENLRRIATLVATQFGYATIYMPYTLGAYDSLKAVADAALGDSNIQHDSDLQHWQTAPSSTGLCPPEEGTILSRRERFASVEDRYVDGVRALWTQYTWVEMFRIWVVPKDKQLMFNVVVSFVWNMVMAAVVAKKAGASTTSVVSPSSGALRDLTESTSKEPQEPAAASALPTRY